MSRYFRFIVFATVLLIGIKAGAQTYPVRVTTTLTPPYSLNITDYGSSAFNKITASIFMADLTQVNYMAKVRLLIKGPNNIVLRTRPGKEIGPVFLNGGQTEIMTGVELASLFDPNNIEFISGLTYSQYMKDGLLPEGVYQFSIEVLDYNQNAIAVSDPNFGIATGWLVLNDPPLINFPADQSTIEPLQPQTIFFQWTPRHTGSPNSAFSVVYDIQMVEIYPADRNPNDAMLTSPVIFEQTVFSTAYNYTIIDPALVEGRWYAFRVRARTINNLDLFRNQGYSQVHAFYYGKPCAVAENINVNSIDATSALVFWDLQQAHLSTEVQYKEKGTSRWSSVISYSNNILVKDLSPGKTYVFRLTGRCANNNSVYSEEVEYTTSGSGSGKECDLPLKEEVKADALSLTSASVSWLTEEWFDQYTFRYRLLTDPGFIEVSSREAKLTLHHLDPDKIYEYQIIYHCRTDKWVTGNFNTFKINVSSDVLNNGGTGDCFPPLDITHTVNNDLTADIKWPKDKEAKSYRVYWKEDVGATSWDSVTTSSVSATLKGLKADTDYLYEIKSICKDDQLSIASKTGRFNTAVLSGTAKKCPVPQTIPFTTISSEEVKLEWIKDTSHTSYVMEYREKNTSFWMASKSTDPLQLVSGLNNSKKYEYHVYAFCGLTTSDFSPTDTFSTAGKAAPVFVCGADKGLTNITNRTPIATLKIGDKFTAADFELEVKTLTSSSPYHGEASAKIPYLKHSSFIFGMEGVQINDQRQMFEGKIYLKKANLSIMDPKIAADIQKMLDFVDQGFTYLEDYLDTLNELQNDINGYIGEIEGGNNTGQVVTGNVQTTQTLSVSVSDASQIKGTQSNGQCLLAITGDDGSNQSLTVAAPATLQDTKGNIYAVDNSCTVSKVAQKITLTQTPSQLDELSSKATMVFVDYTGKQKYGFSAWNKEYAKSPTEWAKRYQLLGSSYRVSSKAIEPAAADLIKAGVTIHDSNVDKTKIIFVSGKGVQYLSKSLGGNEYEVTIVGGPDADAQELYALYPESDGTYSSFGKLLVPAYKKKKRSLVLVPVNGTPVPETEIRQKLNEIYNPYSVEWEVRTDANFTDMSWDEDNNGLEVKGSGLLSTLTGEMMALNAAYKAARSIKPTDIYLFVMPKPETAGVRGDMPRAKQFGYLFVDGASKAQTARVAAHEVGHGLFLLRHTFDGYGMVQDSLPDNLMDYSNGEKLAKLQWDVMHDPGIVLGVFEKDEDAMATANNCPNYNYEILYGDLKNKGATFSYDSKNYIKNTQFVANCEYALNLNRSYKGAADYSTMYVGFNEHVSSFTTTSVNYQTIKLKYKSSTNSNLTAIQFKLANLSEAATLQTKIGRTDLVDLAKGIIFKEIENTKAETSCNSSKIESLLKLLRPEDYNDIPVATRIKLLSLCYSDEELALLLCKNLTEPDVIKSFQSSLLSTKVNGSVLLDILEAEFNDVDMISDGNLSNLSLEFMKQSAIKGELDYGTLLNSMLAKDMVFFWDGINKKMDQTGQVWYIYRSDVKDGKVILNVSEWHPNDLAAGKELGPYTYNSFDSWVLLYITKDIDGVSNAKGSFCLVTGFEFHNIIQGEVNAGTRAAIRIGIDMAALILTGPALKTVDGIRYALLLIELASTTADLILLLERDFFVNQCGMSVSTYENLLFVTGVGQLAGLGAVKWSVVASTFVTKCESSILALENILKAGYRLSADQIENVKTLIANLRSILSRANSVSELTGIFKVFSKAQLDALGPVIDKAVSVIKQRGIENTFVDLSNTNSAISKINEGGMFTVGDLVELPARDFLKKTITQTEEYFLNVELKCYDAKGSQIGGSLREVDALKFNKNAKQIESGVTMKLDENKVAGGISADRSSMNIFSQIPEEATELQVFIRDQGLGLNASQTANVSSAKITFIELTTGQKITLTPAQFQSYLSSVGEFGKFPIEGMTPAKLGVTKEELLEGALELIRQKL